MPPFRTSNPRIDAVLAVSREPRRETVGMTPSARAIDRQRTRCPKPTVGPAAARNSTRITDRSATNVSAERHLPIGLPSLPFHLRLDALCAFFLLVISGAAAGVSAFAAGYFRKGEGTPPGLLCLEYHVFLAAMVMVVLADDAYAFMVMWETMALSSFFLVIANHRIPEIREAGYLYLLIAHIGVT